MVNPVVDDDDPIIEFIINHDMAHLLMEQHADDGTGHCAFCPSNQKPRPYWPCVVWCYADLALAVMMRRWP